MPFRCAVARWTISEHTDRVRRTLSSVDRMLSRAVCRSQEAETHEHHQAQSAKHGPIVALRETAKAQSALLSAGAGRDGVIDSRTERRIQLGHVSHANGQAPCRNPYTDDAAHAQEKSRTKTGERSSSA